MSELNVNNDGSSNWHLDAVFYQVYVRGFKDSSRDGNGDLRGLIEKLRRGGPTPAERPPTLKAEDTMCCFQSACSELRAVAADGNDDEQWASALEQVLGVWNEEWSRYTSRVLGFALTAATPGGTFEILLARAGGAACLH